MIELYQAAISNYNFVYTILLAMVLLYWLVVMLGILDVDAFDFDVDLDADFDVDMDGMEGAFSWLGYFNVGEVPVMLYLSIVILTMWVVSVQVNSFLDGVAIDWVAENRGWIALAMAPLIILFGLFLAKILVIPIKRMRLAGPSKTNLIGKTCIVTSLELNETRGRCVTPKSEGSTILNARTRGGEVLKQGEAVEIVEHVDHEDAAKDIYIVTKRADVVVSDAV